MRDDHHRAVVALDERLEAGARLHIEVCLGLVEEEHGRVLREAGGERDELALAT